VFSAIFAVSAVNAFSSACNRFLALFTVVAIRPNQSTLFAPSPSSGSVGWDSAEGLRSRGSALLPLTTDSAEQDRRATHQTTTSTRAGNEKPRQGGVVISSILSAFSTFLRGCK
jgi:hypothetical protein